jgi:predicted HTH domain antitoxin
MSISFSLPQPIESQLRAQLGNLDQAAKEAAVVELYRQGRLSHGELAESLGTSRDNANAVLKQHGVTEDLIGIDEFNEQAAQLRKLSKP